MTKYEYIQELAKSLILNEAKHRRCVDVDVDGNVALARRTADTVFGSVDEGTPLTAMGSSTRTNNELRREGITTIDDLQKLGRDGLMRKRNFGAGCLEEIDNFMKARGYEF